MTLHVAIDGTEYGEVIRDSLSITEVLGAASTATFRLEDMESAMASAWYVDKKRADVRVWDTVDTGDLFRGQVTNIRASIEGIRRVLEIDAESYDGLLDYTLVGHEVREYADLSHLTVADWLAAASSGTPIDVPTAWADINANTAIALPATDDASVVQAFFTQYWRGPTLTYDIVSHCDVDSGTTIDIFSPDASDRRTFFGLTNLRDVLGQIASLVSTNLAFWIDADLVFHWRIATPVASPSTTSAPSGDVLTSLARMLPVPRDYVFSPYVASIDSDDPFGTLRMEIPLSGVVDGVYVQGGTTQASGLVDYGTTYGAQAYVSAPWTRLTGDKYTAAEYARDEYNGSGRLTIMYETAADWHDVHVGQGLTLYHPAVGIGTAKAYVIRQADITFLPDNVRRYSLQLGDGRLRTMSGYGSRVKDPKRKNAPESVPWPDRFAGGGMGWLWQVSMTDVAPAPGSSQGVWVQYTDQSGQPCPIDGLKITWGVDIALGTDPIGSDGNRTPTRYTGSDATSESLMFYLTYPTSVTTGGGRATNILTTHANASADDTCVVWVAYQ